MRSLPLTLVARLIPVAVLAAAGVAMTATGDSDARPQRPAAASPSPSAPATTTTAPPRYPKAPPEACETLPAATVKELVPGARTSGNELRTSDLTRRTGCSWHALDGYDYRWLDIAYDVTGRTASGKEADSGSAVSGLGDKASIRERLTTDDGQRIREAVVTVHQDNATVTVTYNGGDFGSHEAASAAVIREGALAAAEKALAALDG